MIFQDGKIIFVRHSSVYVRVSANRIVKKGKEFKDDAKEVEVRSENFPVAKPS